MSLVKSTLTNVAEGEETSWRRIFKPWDNWNMDCLCVPFKGLLGKTKYWSAIERGMVVGARRTGFGQELLCCWVLSAQQFPMCITNGPLPKGHPANLTQLKVFLMFGILSVNNVLFNTSWWVLFYSYSYPSPGFAAPDSAWPRSLGMLHTPCHSDLCFEEPGILSEREYHSWARRGTVWGGLPVPCMLL